MASVRKQQRVVLIALVAACAAMAATMVYLQESDSQAIVKGLDQNTINTISISQPNSQPIVVERRGETWQLTQPIKQEANLNRIEPLLTIATFKPAYPSSEVDREAAGLTQPIATISYNDKRFDIGASDVSGKRRYAESDGEVYFFPEWIVPFIAGGANALAAQPND